jgi:hypothetical protein
VGGVGVHGTARDVQRVRGPGLGQLPVILQRDHLALPQGQVIQRSRDGRPPRDDSPAPAACHLRRHRSAIPRKRPGPAQLRLGHQPQIGFRAFAVHSSSVQQLRGAANQAAPGVRLPAAATVPGPLPR